MNNTSRILNLCGIVAPVLFAAVIIYCGLLQPGYSHYSQVMSVLAARGSSTEWFARVGGWCVPGLLTAGFGFFLLKNVSRSKVAVSAALLVIVNGLGRFSGGVFNCDPGCQPVDPSVSQRIHNPSTVIAYLALGVACGLWAFSAKKIVVPRWFGWYSLTSAILGLGFFAALVASALMTHGGVGLFQRLSFGILNLWILALAILIWFSARRPDAWR